MDVMLLSLSVHDVMCAWREKKEERRYIVGNWYKLVSLENTPGVSVVRFLAEICKERVFGGSMMKSGSHKKWKNRKH